MARVVKNGEISGTSRRSLRLEGIKMNISNSDLAGSVEYRTHVQEIGWQGYVKDNQLSGTSGKSAPEGNGKAFLIGNEAKRPDEIKPTVNYQTHVQNIGWQGVVKNGEIAGTSGKIYNWKQSKST